MKKTKEMKMGLMGMIMALLVCLLWVTPVKVMAADTQVSALIEKLNATKKL